MSDTPGDSLVFNPVEVSARWPGIPPLILEGLCLYFNQRLPVGGFLMRALSNDFAGACLAADPDSLAALRQIAGALSGAPSDAWGSPMLVARWLQAGRAARERG